MKQALAAIAVSAFCIAALSSAANATTITFGTNNGAAPQSVGTAYTESGFRFASDQDLFRWPNGSTFDSDPTPSTGLFTNFQQTTTIISRLDGTPFDLSSIDFDDVHHDGTFSGFLDYEFAFSGGGSGAGSVLVDGIPGFTTVLFNLASLNWFSFKPSDHLVFVQFDNVQIVDTAVTPLPATLPLFASAIVGLGWLARRRSKTGAPAPTGLA